MRILFILLLCISNFCNGEWFNYDKAIYDAQHENWDSSLQRLNSNLIEHPDDPSLLYDAGVVSYRSDNFKQAQDYFKRASQSPLIEKPLQKQSFFNLGNAYCALEEYKQAVSAYEDALRLDPNDERVQHNLKKARELLAAQQKKNEEQKKQDQQQEQNKQKEQQDQNSESSEQKQNDQKQQSSSDKDRQQETGQNGQQDKQSGQQQSKDKKNKKICSGNQ